jgi:hypothetical protein
MVFKPMTVNGKYFQRKGDARKYVGDIRKKYLDRPGVPFDQEDMITIVEWTILTHEEAEEKIGCGVDRVVILDDETNYHHGVNGNDGRVLHFVRFDGSMVPVSLDGKRSHKQDVLQAMRREVSRVCRAPCTACGSSEGPFNGHHDVMSFVEIVLKFMDSMDLTFDFVLVHRYGVARKLSDRNLAAEWKQFHDSMANVVTVCAKCHNKVTYGER